MSFMGIADANVAKMVIDEINAGGGLLGQQIELYLEDNETTDSAAEACGAKLVQQDGVHVIFGGILSSTRQAIKASAVTEGKTLYSYPEQSLGVVDPEEAMVAA
jgi:ABC-type branched-subunit amino acid transport system substrate-binding protein